MSYLISHGYNWGHQDLKSSLKRVSKTKIKKIKWIRRGKGTRDCPYFYDSKLPRMGFGYLIFQRDKYCVCDHMPQKEWVLSMDYHQEDIHDKEVVCKSVEEAKSVAQQDFEERLLSYIVQNT